MQKIPDMIRSTINRDGTQKVGKYVLVKKLGQGQFGIVWRAYNSETKENFAVKQIKRSMIDRSSKLKQLLGTEISIMHQINHPNILHLYDYYQSSNNYYLVLKLCNQGTFTTYMQDKGVTHFEEQDALYFLLQIMNGFFELRKHKILHRDFKLDNILMHDETLIIGDFGFAKSGQEITSTKVGTPLTMAPELLFSNGDALLYNSKADLWSIGVVFYQIIFGRPPYIADTIPQLKVELLKNTDTKITFPLPISEEAKDLLRRLLTVDPVKRIDWADFFAHPLFKKSLNTRQNDMKTVFGSLGVMQSMSAMQEFYHNQKQAQKEVQSKQNQVFLDPENIPVDTQFKAQTINEVTVPEKEDQAIYLEAFHNQMYYRYCHELNKVFFFIYATKKMQSFLKKGRFPEASELIMNISLLTLKKGIVFNNNLFSALINNVNIFNLYKPDFPSFCSSERYTEIKTHSNNNKDSMFKHLSLVCDRARENKIRVNCYDTISLKEPKIAAIDQQLFAHFEQLKSLKLAESIGSDKSLLRDYYHFLILLRYIYDPNKYFPYLSHRPKCDKFNWNNFYYTLDRASIDLLKQYV